MECGSSESCGISFQRHMKFSEQLEARYDDMITHYPVKRSALQQGDLF